MIRFCGQHRNNLEKKYGLIRHVDSGQDIIDDELCYVTTVEQRIGGRIIKYKIPVGADEIKDSGFPSEFRSAVDSAVIRSMKLIHEEGWPVPLDRRVSQIDPRVKRGRRSYD